MLQANRTSATTANKPKPLGFKSLSTTSSNAKRHATSSKGNTDNEPVDDTMDTDEVIPSDAMDIDETTPSETTTLSNRPAPRLTNSLHERFFSHSALPKAFELERIQPFGKNNINQSFTADKTFYHIVLIVFKSNFLTRKERCRVKITCPTFKKMWREWKLVRDLQPVDFLPLLQQPPNWESQTQIDERRVHLRLALLLHYNFDLAAVHRFVGGNHTAAHMDPDRILPLVKDLLDEPTYNHLERILRFGCPAYLNAHCSRENYLKYRNHGNHRSLQENEKQAKSVMVKEDKREFVLTFPAWTTDLIPDLFLNPQALIVIPDKKDRLVFDSSYMVDADSRPYNADCNLLLEPEIYFGSAFERHLKNIYCIRISFPGVEIYIMDDDIVAAFRQIKMNPNVISAKAFVIDKYLHVCTGQNFGDKPSPANFEPVAKGRMALASHLSIGEDLHVPEFERHMNAITFAPPPAPGTYFATARPDKYNQGVINPDGSSKPAEFNMYVDDDLYAAVGVDRMRWLIRCSIQSAYLMFGEPDLSQRPDPIDFDKFVREMISHMRTQLGYTINTRLLTVTIPERKRIVMLELLNKKWGPRRRSFKLKEAAELLGTLMSLCRVCKWGIFLFTNILRSINEMLSKNARRLMNSPEFVQLTQEASLHPTDSSQYRFFSSRIARQIWNEKALTYINTEIREELNFIQQVFSDPVTYDWSSPIAHLIKREQDYEIWQDSSLRGAGGFSFGLNFWWTLEWPQTVERRTLRHLRKGDKHLISINLLEYAAIIISLAGAILAWEQLPEEIRPIHPISLLWTDNTSAASWTKRIAGLKGPQGKTLARIFAHLLMFSDMGVNADHIKGIENVIADFLSRIRETDNFSQFSYSHLVQKFPQLKHCRHFHPSPELLSLITTALSSGCSNIPTTRVPLGQLLAA